MAEVVLESPQIRQGAALDDEKQLELSLRPSRLGEYIGQKRIKDNMRVYLKAALQRREALDHVLLAGPPGTGKCITGNSLVLTERGLVPLRELVPPTLQAGESAPLTLKVYGTEGVEETSHVYASGYVPTRRVRTRAGFVLEGTPHHPVLVATPDGPQWKTLAELGPDDYVALGRGTNLWSQQEQQAIWHLDSAPHRQARRNEIVQGLHTALAQTLGRPPAAIELSYAYVAVTGNKTAPTTFRPLAQRLGLELSNGLRVKHLARQLPALTVAPPVLPNVQTISLDADLAYLLGVLTGDGNIEKGATAPAFVITCVEPEMQRELQRITEKHFGRVPKVAQYPDKAAKLRFSQTVGRVCLDLGVKAVNAAEKVVPAAVLRSPREVVIGFLQGLFDADGYVQLDGYVELDSRSVELVGQVQLLLANLGIIASVTEKQVTGASFWRLFIAGQQACLFHELVGFRLARKRLRASALGEVKRGWQRSELVPCTNGLLRALLEKSRPLPRAVHKTFYHVTADDRTPTRAQVERYLALLPSTVHDEPEYHTLQTLTNPHFYWDKVAQVQASEAFAYDFVVPQTHSFVANGFFNHNTTLSLICANEMGAKLHSTSAPVIEKAGDLAAILTNLEEGDVLFIDEIHRLHPAIEEVLYPAMEDFQLDIMIGQGPAARSIKLDLPKFTLVGATTRAGLITAPLRGRFGINFHLELYSHADLEIIVKRSASILGVEIADEGAEEIARRARGTPRIVNRLLRRVRDFAQVEYDGRITHEVSQDALNRMEVDTYGLDEVDRKLLLTIMEKFDGGPVGLGTLAAAIHEERDSIEEVIEPYLLQMGLLNRTPRGRVVTRHAYEHFGLTPYVRLNLSE